MDTELLEKMIAWEQGQLTRKETSILFQVLIDTRLVWRLTNAYGRCAMKLIDIGHCTVKG